MTDGCAKYIKENWEKVLGSLPPIEDEIFQSSSESMDELSEGGIDLIVTSPPYPMVERWDAIGGYADQHEMIARVLHQCYHVLKEGGIMCINIGDATRTVNDQFTCFPNHSEVTLSATDVGFTPLIPILWFKQSNKPNSFMGSGFYPPNGYVTQEHEYILIFRKGPKKTIYTGEPLVQASKFTKEERDTWFSQRWDVRGAGDVEYAQFPPEIPYRLIRMFSHMGDTVLDPFMGTGTTGHVAKLLNRSFVGYEVDRQVFSVAREKLRDTTPEPKDVLRNYVRNEEGGLGVGVFLRNTNTLVDPLE